jgi:POT family proton-dependent oligopeptide transporter
VCAPRMTDVAATTPAQAADLTAEPRDNRMPKGIPYIVANEFAERFCYYGINAILTVYMTQTLAVPERQANVYHSLFKTAAYFSPLIGAFVSDVLWGKFKTILTFSMSYCLGCAIVALVPGVPGLLTGLTLVALGTGGIKPCVSTNVGDQFTSKNSHLIEKAYSYFYLAINSGSSISIFFCPVLLDPFNPEAKPRFVADWLIRSGIHGRLPAFGTPAVMMFLATLVFWLGRKKFAVVPPAGWAWVREVFSKEGVKTVGRLAIIYVFLAPWWGLWEQSNGQTWTLQAESSLMNKDLGFGLTLLPAQIQVVNGLFILALVPVFTFVVYPLWSKVTTVTPLRKIAVGLFVIAVSYLIVARIEAHIQAGESVSLYWQFLAYIVLTASEVLVSITALEFSYKQAPLRMKSFIMSLFLLSISGGDVINAIVNSANGKPVAVETVEAGTETWVTTPAASSFIVGQKIDFDGKNGLTMTKEGKPVPLQGTFLVEKIDEPGHRLALMDVVWRKPVATSGAYSPDSKASVGTYKLVGPEYFNFFAGMMTVVGLLFIGVAALYKEKTHLRDEGAAAKA